MIEKKSSEFQIVKDTIQTYHPYKDVDEFLKASKMHGPYIKTATGSFLPTYIISQGIIDCRGYTILYSEILKDYTWQDGTLCGILEE